MMVRAKWSIKDGNGWHDAGDIFDADEATVKLPCVEPIEQPKAEKPEAKEPEAPALAEPEKKPKASPRRKA